MMRFGTTLLSSALLLVGLSLKGEVLYWMVDDQTANEFPYAYASVSSSSGGYLPYVDDEGQTWSGVYEFEPASFTDGGVYVDVDGLETANPTFRVELFNSAGQPIAHGDALEYAYLRETGRIAASRIIEVGEQQGPWTGVADEGGKFTAAGTVPEPTSGLLMLMGLAGLMLRRRCA